VLTEGHRTGVTLFLSGQVAMVSTGLPFLAQVRNANPALYAGVAVAPQIGARKNISMMNLAVPAASPQVALAMRLAQHVASNENQLALARRVPVLPSTRRAYEDPLFTQAGDDALLDRARALSAAQVREGEVLVPPVRRWSQLRTSFVRNLQATMLGRQSSAAALADIDRSWRALLDCEARRS
jgi:putative chitobiose transport system substrate-binding protein